MNKNEGVLKVMRPYTKPLVSTPSFIISSLFLYL